MKLSVSGMKKPEARPPANWKASSIGRLVENGSRNEMIANAVAAWISARRAPNRAPSQSAKGKTSICAVVCAVVIQAPSS